MTSAGRVCSCAAQTEPHPMGQTPCLYAEGRVLTPTCIYSGCRKEAVGVLPRWRNHPDPGHPYKQDWPLCAEHSKQKAHPRDIDMRKFEPFEEQADV